MTTTKEAPTREERKRLQDQQQRAHRIAEHRRCVDVKPIADRFVYDVPCSTDGCAGVVPVLPKSLVGTEGGRCMACGPSPKAPPDKQLLSFERRLQRVGLKDQPELVRALGLTAKRPDPPRRAEGAWRTSARACAAFAKERAGGLLFLSGPPQTGKTTAAAGVAWDTQGHFLERRVWIDLVPWDEHAKSERAWLIQHAGVLVLDEICTVAAGQTSDTKHTIGIVNDLVRGRHARHLSTILTTNANMERFLDLYGTVGEALLSRATGDLYGESNTGACGWVDTSCSTGER